MTQEDRNAPGMYFDHTMSHYRAYQRELAMSFEQSRRLDLSRIDEYRLADEPAPEQVRRLFGERRVDIPLSVGDNDVADIIRRRAGRLEHTLTGHTGSVQSVAFHPGGGQLARGGADGTVRLWSSSSGPDPARLTLLGLPEGWAAFTPDGRYKSEGEVASQFWHVVGMCRFEIGELDANLAEVARVPVDEPLGWSRRP